MTNQNSAKTLYEKIWESHIVAQKPGHPAVFGIDLMLVHEVTSAQAFKTLEDRKISVFDKNAVVATLDHSIPTRKNRLEIYDGQAKIQVETLRENCKRHGIRLYDFDSGHQGIVHVIGPELGLTQPGMTIVCGDSHTSTHGAFGALAFGIGTSEVGHVLASGAMLQSKSKTMRVNYVGEMPKGIFSKDLILKLISLIGIGGANGYVIEYCGEALKKMTMAERMTICNMSIECGARAGLIAPDEVTFDYIKGRQFAPQGEEFEEAKARWEKLVSDPGAKFDKEIEINLATLSPLVTWGTNPGQGMEITQSIPLINTLPKEQQLSAEQALKYVKLQEGEKLEGVKIDWAFLGSCTNGRIEDLRIAAKMLENRQISKEVKMYIVPGSEQVREQAIQEGLEAIFIKAGADFRMPGCSMCLGMNDDQVPEGMRCISSSNRNFVGRQGPGSITHLASPATVVASAIEGKITSPLKFL